MLRRSLAQLLSNVKGAEFNPMIPEHSPGVRRPLLIAISHPQLSHEPSATDAPYGVIQGTFARSE